MQTKTIFVLIYLVFALPCVASAENKKTEPTKKSTVEPNLIPAEEKRSDFVEKATDIVEETTQKVSEAIEDTRTRRAATKYFVLGNYSPIDLIIPSKYGVTIGFIENEDKTWELEYLRKSINFPFILSDIGSMTEQRLSFIGRSYFGSNSFNISYGLSYFDFSMSLGDNFLGRSSIVSSPALDLVAVQAIGFNVAVGNRWTIEHNFTFGVDWISWAQPLFITKNESEFTKYVTNQKDKDDLDRAIKMISYFPRFALLKLQFGFLF